MGKLKHKRLYIFAAIALIAAAFVFGYSWRSSQRARSYRLAKRTQQLAPEGVAEQQMLQGKFGEDVPAEQRQIVAAELQASDQPTTLNQPVDAPTQVRPGEQHITLTQPLGTTVEDTQPILTWDARLDGWSYRVTMADQNSSQSAVTSPVLDEAMWTVPAPLFRGHTYLWSVEAIPVGIHTAAKAVTSSNAQFSVLSAEGEQAIQNAKTHNASHLLLGSLYTHYEMWREAVLEYRKMVDEVPDSPEATRLLRNAEVRSSSKVAAGHAR